IYNNYFYGPGSHVTGHIYLEGQDSSSQWTNSTGQAFIWNNVLVGTVMFVTSGRNFQILNNTLIGDSETHTGNGGIMAATLNPTIKNNYIAKIGVLLDVSLSRFSVGLVAFDNNAYSNCATA